MRINYLYILLLIIFISACSEKPDKKPLAQVGEKLLYLEDVQKVLPERLSDTDSSIWIDDFIKKWVQQELMILNAEENLPLAQKDVSREVEDYRNSILTYRYKKALMEQKMDTTISIEQINSYYADHVKEFVLKSDIVKAIYLKAPLEVANKKTIKSLSMDNNPQNLQELDEYCIRYAKAYDRFEDKWIVADQLLVQFPEEIDNLERFLRRNKFIESEDTDYYYFICIRDFKFKGENAPVEFVSSSIKNILLNQRKINFLKKIEADVYKEGLESNRFRLYNIQK